MTNDDLKVIDRPVVPEDASRGPESAERYYTRFYSSTAVFARRFGHYISWGWR